MTTSAASEQQHQSRERRRSRFSTGSIALVVLVLAIAALGGWYAGLLKPRPTVALVTNNADPFWDPVIAGAERRRRSIT
jgi:hypothetical protein